MEGEFFVIEIKTDKGEGFIIDSPEGIQVCTGGFTADVKQFTRKTEANEFSEKNKLYKYGKIRIVPNSEIMEKYGKKSETGELYAIENEKEHRLFYDTREEAYFFEPERKVGCCCWYDKGSCDDAVTKLQTFFQDNILKSVKL